MKRCLADVNVLLPLLIPHHMHHKAVRQWFENLRAGEAVLCRFVQLALIRLLCNRAIMGKDVLSASAASRVIATLMEDERLEFMAEPSAIDAVFPKFLNDQAPAHKLAGDAYLAAFSTTASLRMTTFDQGFRRFRGIDLELLAV